MGAVVTTPLVVVGGGGGLPPHPTCDGGSGGVGDCAHLGWYQKW